MEGFTMKKWILALIVLIAIGVGYYLYSQKMQEHAGTPVTEEQPGTSVGEEQPGTEVGTPGEKTAPSESGEPVEEESPSED